jgi:uncharacterized membrane protein
MHFALVIIGALLGVIIQGVLRTPSPIFPAFLGGFVGYVMAELRALRARGSALEDEIAVLKDRLARLQRERADAGHEAPLRRGAATGEPARSGSAPTRGTLGPAADSGLTQAADPAAASAAGVLPSAAARSAPAFELRDSAARTSLSGAAGARLPETRAESPILKVVREYFTGGNTLVRVGILILFFGVAFLLRYVAEHSHVSIQFRLAGVALAGVVLLLLGWWLRLRRAGYALALQGGGVGILYLTTFAALRLYALLPSGTGFAILVALAAFSAVLAVLQDSQAFAVLAVTGGFLAPILASTGGGSHVVLFSYYAVLDASILVIAWYKAWRALNLAGFVFTFLISAAWGALHYESALFASTEPFLVAFLLFYIAIAILFSMRQPPNLRGYIDGTLVFGTPMATFGYQSGMLHDRPALLALSAGVMAAAYFLLAWMLHVRQRSSQRLLVEAFIALGVVFFTVATPLALNGTATGVTWALEGAALVWVGARQNRTLPRVFGPLLQIAVALIQIAGEDGFLGAAPPFGLYVARAITAVAAVLSGAILWKYRDRLRPFEAVSSPVLFFLGVAEWVFCGLVEIYASVPYGYDASCALVFVALTAILCSQLSRQEILPLGRLPALSLLPAMFVFAALGLGRVFGPTVRHPFDYAGWLAWPLAFAAFYLICRRHEGEPGSRLARTLHVLSAWLLVALLTWQVAWSIDRGVAGRGSWVAVGWMLIPAIVLLVLPRLVQRISWPLQAHRETYVVRAGAGLAVYLALWSLVTNFLLVGDPYPFPYAPLLNPLDVAQALALGVLARYCLQLRAGKYPVYVEVGGEAFAAGWASLCFIWLNAALIRALHYWAGVTWNFESVLNSTLVQSSLSLFWTVLALATMLLATRRAARTVWITGAFLLAVTIVKLFVIDLSRVGTVERIVSFVGVGLLTLVIGYFSPLPPAATSESRSAL